MRLYYYFYWIEFLNPFPRPLSPRVLGCSRLSSPTQQRSPKPSQTRRVLVCPRKLLPAPIERFIRSGKSAAEKTADAPRLSSRQYTRLFLLLRPFRASLFRVVVGHTALADPFTAHNKHVLEMMKLGTPFGVDPSRVISWFAIAMEAAPITMRNRSFPSNFPHHQHHHRDRALARL